MKLVPLQKIHREQIIDFESFQLVVDSNYFHFFQENYSNLLNLLFTKVFQTLSFGDIFFELLFQLIFAILPNNNDYSLVKKNIF